MSAPSLTPIIFTFFRKSAFCREYTLGSKPRFSLSPSLTRQNLVMTMLQQTTGKELMSEIVLSRTKLERSADSRVRVSAVGLVRADTAVRAPALLDCPVGILRASCGFAALFSLCFFTGLLFQPSSGQAQTATAPAANQFMVVELEGKVDVMRSGSAFWDRADTNQVLAAGDRLRTGDSSRAVLRASNLTLLRLDSRSFFEVPREQNNRPIWKLLRGALYLFHRDKPGLFPFDTPTMSAVVRGTEFNLQVDEDGTSTLTLLDGAVEMTNQFGHLSLQGAAAGRAEPGKAPVQTAVLPAINVIQWCLYYPGTLDLDELKFSADEQQALRASLDSYRSGDLLAAVTNYPAGRTPASSEEKIYSAALDLAVGQVEQTEKVLDELNAGLAGALRKIIAAVKLEALPSTLNIQHSTFNIQLSTSSASEWLAESYYQQSLSKLEPALAAARRAVEKSPNFAFAWERVAELEFSFGRTRLGLEALEKSLRLAPRNAQALALKGFLLSAQNRISEARRYFDQAIALDGALGNAWLGRGLCRIHQGDAAGGLADLQVAATVEPQRALFRDYLGKAYSNAGDTRNAGREIALAKTLDANDPIGWLYSALLNQQRNRVNEAVRDLEKSQDLNNNRSLYRSRLLLDQDRSVRSVNLASILQDAGLFDVSVWEAGRAVNADYANFSGHLFLANSYQILRDPKGVNQRFETPAVSEYLLANLLAPVGAGTLAQTVTQQEYSKLFEDDGVGFASSTEYLSRGAWTESAAQYGTFGNLSYALSAFYASDPGQRRNNDLEETEFSLQLKYQITPSDSVYVRPIIAGFKGGDLAQVYDPNATNSLQRFKETQQPLLLAGYHHEWGPGVHTLFLAGRLLDTLRESDPSQRTLFLLNNGTGSVQDAWPILMEEQYRSETEIYTAEAQQIWQREEYAVIGGVRYQTGDFHTRAQQLGNSNTFSLSPQPGLATLFFLPGLPQAPQSVVSDFDRLSFYGYGQWRVVEPLQLTAGMSYDRLNFPQNFRYAPLSDQQESTDRLSPKAGFIWTPTRTAVVRFAYTRSLGGVGFDQSFRLEPTQVAGFNQAFRSIIPESVAGANSAATFDTWDLSLEQKFGRGTYLGIAGERLESKVSRIFGAFAHNPPNITSWGGTPEKLDYNENSMVLNVNQLVGNEWSFGARYRLSDAHLRNQFVDLPAASYVPSSQNLEAVLHELNLFTNYNHPSGFFGEAQGLWYRQSNHGDASSLAGDDFWQVNLFAGYRFPRRQAEVRIGLLNVTAQDYRLNPLSLTPELPRDRTLALAFRFYF